VRSALVANGHTEFFAWSAHRFGNGSCVRNETVHFTSNRRGTHRDSCKLGVAYPSITSCHLHRICSACNLLGHPDWQLDLLDETSVRRSDGINRENCLARLDTETFRHWWQHPIFTPGGFWIFWSDLLASFWRGEVKWHGQILRCEFADGFYAISSVALLVAALIGLRRGTGLSTFQRQAISIAALSFIISVGFLALLSIQFDFGNCVNPSNAHPYFTSGRLLSGALIPFAVAYVYGIAYLFRRINSAVPVAVLALIIVFATTSEIVTNYGVFASEYNFFHI